MNIYRFFLFALLPAIAIFLYIEGQKYDPALISFTASEGGIEGESFIFPLEIEGLTQTGQTSMYSKENLYEYINGHAEYFISAGFVRLSVREYISAGPGSDKPDAILEIYDMGKDIQAFGILADEAEDTPSTFRPGVMGFKDSQGISFATGKYYVRINTFKEFVPVDKFAERIVNTMAIKAVSFPLFSRFPDLGEVIATRYIKEAYRGLDFLNDVIEREYKVGDSTLSVFVVTGENREVSELMGSFTDYFQKSDIQYSVLEKKTGSIYKMKDPYEGDWVLISLSDALFGIYGSFDETTINHFIAY